MTRHERPFLSVRDNFHASRFDSHLDQITGGGLTSPIAQCQIVFFRTSLVTMALNGYVCIRVLPEPARVFLQRGLGINTSPAVVLIEPAIELEAVIARCIVVWGCAVFVDDLGEGPGSVAVVQIGLRTGRAKNVGRRCGLRSRIPGRL